MMHDGHNSWSGRRSAAILLLTALIGAALDRPAVAMPRNARPGDPVPQISLTDLDGKVAKTAEWRGRPGVLIFVAAGQSSSERALRALQAARDTIAADNIGMLALTADAVQVPYFRELGHRAGLRIPVALDPGRDVYGRIGVIVLPTTLFYDKSGKLAFVISGYDLSYQNTAEAHLKLLAGRISADEHAQRLVTTRPGRDDQHDRADRLCRSAEFMRRRGLTTQAAAELEKAIEADPSYAPARLQLADLRALTGDLAGAEALVADVRKSDPRNRQAGLLLGTIRFRQGKLDEAQKLLEEALLLNPDPARTNYWLGRVFEARGAKDRAALHYRAAIEQLVPDLAAGPTPPRS